MASFGQFLLERFDQFASKYRTKGQERMRSDNILRSALGKMMPGLTRDTATRLIAFARETDRFAFRMNRNPSTFRLNFSQSPDRYQSGLQYARSVGIPDWMVQREGSAIVRQYWSKPTPEGGVKWVHRDQVVRWVDGETLGDLDARSRRAMKAWADKINEYEIKAGKPPRLPVEPHMTSFLSIHVTARVG